MNQSCNIKSDDFCDECRVKSLKGSAHIYLLKGGDALPLVRLFNRLVLLVTSIRIRRP